ncbi:MAG: hypothetical protein QOH71_4143 [Blastocatellia bacterium]|jgi:hypothetical protein|nr:hypothetical protein [Blastocatellia bacterium]
MKHTMIGLALLVLILAGFNLACNPKSDTSQAPTPTPRVESLSSPSSTPTPNQPGSGNLVDATATGDIGYELTGYELGDSTKMNLKVRNKTERVWEVKVEVGTKLEPSESGVQQMVVTKEVDVHLEPHDEKRLELEVDCLDISKAAPSRTNTKWRLESSNNLSQFIRCASEAATDLKARGELDEDERRGVIQLALWQARGATHDQWVKFYEDYQNLSPADAEQAIEETQPIAKKIISRCPSL